MLLLMLMGRVEAVLLEWLDKFDLLDPHWEVTAKRRRTGEQERDRLRLSFSTLTSVDALQLLLFRLD